jgi:hypothetical protein
VYGWVRPAFTGPGWLRGLKFGVVVLLLSACGMLAWSGVFGLPERIWAWWFAESVVYTLPGAAALGWTAQRFAPEGRRL